MDRNWRIFAGLIFLFCTISVSASQPEGPQIEFETENYDYGIVYTDDLPGSQVEIEFTNTGTAPLIISRVQGCCGTRVTQWPRSPINPGEKGIINLEIRLNPRAHRISRTLTVSSNSAESPTTVFRIIGEVVERQAEPPR